MRCPDCGSKAHPLPKHRYLADGCQCSNAGCRRLFSPSEPGAQSSTDLHIEIEPPFQDEAEPAIAS